MQIAIVLYPGFTALDAVGPYEVLRLLPEAEVRFVGAAPGPVVADSGVLFLGVTHSYAETPEPDIVLVPGSGPRTATTMADRQLTGWLRRVHETTRWTTSVCTGAMILAAAGILDGLPATTHWMTHQLYIEYDPRPPFDAGHPSKASKTVIGNARTLGRKIAINPSEARAVPTIAWRRTVDTFRKRKGLS
jgi:putative intracellular protease/amidase